jgi:AcrR family transcriptional regulator
VVCDAGGVSETTSAPPTPGSRHRERLLAGMAAAVREKGFRGTTLADVVRHAGVSRRTFYEHFTDLVECYLALIEEVGDQLLAAVAQAMASDATLAERLDRAVGVYLDRFSADPELNRSYWTELHLTGERGRRLTHTMSGRVGHVLEELSEEARRQDPSLRPLTLEMGVMVASGIRELALLAHDQGRPLDDARATSVEVLRRLVGLAPD